MCTVVNIQVLSVLQGMVKKRFGVGTEINYPGVT